MIDDFLLSCRGSAGQKHRGALWVEVPKLERIIMFATLVKTLSLHFRYVALNKLATACSGNVQAAHLSEADEEQHCREVPAAALNTKQQIATDRTDYYILTQPRRKPLTRNPEHQNPCTTNPELLLGNAHLMEP